MSSPAALLRTPFFALQQARGARFVPFAGWEMAVQFSGVLAEHTAVRTQVGLFDVSHMGEISVEGPQSAAFLEHVMTNAMANLRAQQARYTLMCQADGGIVDDLIVYCESPRHFFLCVNAACVQSDLAHLHSLLAGFDCEVRDVSANWAQLALQGPAAPAVLAALGFDAAQFAALPAFAWCDTLLQGQLPVRLARTGYTGELGCELYCQPAVAAPLFLALEQAGQAHGLRLCGLACRDTLRLEMKYPLYGSDIDRQHNPFEAGLGWAVKLHKKDFVGRAALAASQAAGPPRRWVGFRMLQRGIARPGYAMVDHGATLGVVTSGTHSPSLGVPIGCGYVPAAYARVGSQFAVMIRNQAVPAAVVATPFYRARS